MKKLLIILLIVICAVVTLLMVNLFNKTVEVNGVEIEKVEIYRHSELMGYAQFDVSKLQQGNLIKVLNSNKELSIFKKAFYEDAQLVSPKIQFELITPEYDVVIYFKDRKPIFRNLWLVDGHDKGSYRTGTKMYIIPLESTQALYGLINK